MAKDILMTRKGYTLRPFDEVAAEDMLGLSEGPFMVTIVKPRSVAHNRFYFACIGSICASGGFDEGVDAFHDMTKIEAGCFKTVKARGEFYKVPDSTAFDAMDQTAFNPYFEKAVTFWRSEGYIDWIKPDLRRRLEDSRADA